MKLGQATKLVKQLNSHMKYKNYVFSADKKKSIGQWVVEVHEIEKDYHNKINLTHHKIIEAFSVIFDCGVMINVDIDRNPYYYFY